MRVDHDRMALTTESEEQGNVANRRGGSMNMNHVVVVDAAEKPGKLEDQTAEPYFAEGEPPDLRISKNINAVPAPLEAVLEVPNDRRNTASYRGCLCGYHEDAKRTCCLDAGAVRN